MNITKAKEHATKLLTLLHPGDKRGINVAIRQVAETGGADEKDLLKGYAACLESLDEAQSSSWFIRNLTEGNFDTIIAASRPKNKAAEAELRAELEDLRTSDAADQYRENVPSFLKGDTAIADTYKAMIEALDITIPGTSKGRGR